MHKTTRITISKDGAALLDTTACMMAFRSEIHRDDSTVDEFKGVDVRLSPADCSHDEDETDLPEPPIPEWSPPFPAGEVVAGIGALITWLVVRGRGRA